MPNCPHPYFVFSLLFVLTASVPSCATNQPPIRHGVWELDQADWERDLDETCALFVARAPDGDVDAFREKLESAFEGHQWVFRNNGTYEKVAGAMPTHGRYEVHQSGADWVVYRLYPDPDVTGWEDMGIESLNAMSAEEVAEEIGFRNGPAPFLVGFEFESDQQVRGFALELDQEKNITDNRDYGHRYNLAP